VSPGLFQWEFFCFLRSFTVVVVILLTVGAMEFCLFVLWLLFLLCVGQIHFVLVVFGSDLRS
jgi:hypothetical protein